ncbi:hypothetical protein MYX82_09605 [Acidobacteria bacterium AH-259-D05]|nr:hypothetical protein [Acidobacteria bacterium AH-259-D05]
MFASINYSVEKVQGELYCFCMDETRRTQLALRALKAERAKVVEKLDKEIKELEEELGVKRRGRRKKKQTKAEK